MSVCVLCVCVCIFIYVYINCGDIKITPVLFFPEVFSIDHSGRRDGPLANYKKSTLVL